MPLAIDFSTEDIQRGKMITPAWYRVHINGVESKLAKNGDSTNYVVNGTIVRNSDTPTDKTFDGFPTPYWNFNSKAKGFMIGFFAAFGIEIESGKRYDIEAMTGKELDVFIENGIREDTKQMQNQINHKYRKASE